MAQSDAGGMIFKTGLFAILAALGFWIFSKNSASSETNASEKDTSVTTAQSAEITENWQPDCSQGGTLVKHRWFSLSYIEAHEQAEWVAHELTKDRLNSQWADRGGMSFMPDPLVPTESATPRDYTGSGYDRGHLCPAADMAFDTAALRETFYMSNISPQAKGFNTGVWKELEIQVRRWARQHGRLYVVTGPLLSRQGIRSLGTSEVTVPVGFYKVLYAPDQEAAIGFVVPNQKTEKAVMDYAFNVDYVEKLSGIDFSPHLPEKTITAAEAKIDMSLWPVKTNSQ